MSDLITSLRALAAAEHDDLSVAAEAADEIERQAQLIEALERIQRETVVARHRLAEGMSQASALRAEVERARKERDEARAEVERQVRLIERQARHIEELQQKIDAEKSCGCSYDAPGDVCAAHSPALTAARAEVERAKREHGIDLSRLDEYRMRAGVAERERDEARAEVERLRKMLTRAASYVRSCHDEWHEEFYRAEAMRDLTEIRAVLNNERAGEFEDRPGKF